jgi:hypothetical protein
MQMMIRPIRLCVGIFVGSVACALPGAKPEWFPFGPPLQDFRDGSVIDLRHLNEAYAGANGWIEVDGHRFVHEASGEPVRFWAANIGMRTDFSWQDWQYLARLLAKYGVNLVRFHGPLIHSDAYTRTEQDPDIDPLDFSESKLRTLQMGMAAMKAEGIYSHLSIYFPLWLKPPTGHPTLQGYDGKQPTVAAIYFNEELQRRYEAWWLAVLSRENPFTGMRPLDDPALMGIELVNEDSLFFPTFDYGRIPLVQMTIMETHFGNWLKQRYPDLDTIPWLASEPHTRDLPAAGRFGFNDLRTMADRKSPRDKETAAFLFEHQRDWYTVRTEWFRTIGFKGLVTASNWITANDLVFDGLERASYLSGDFIDHHRAYYHGRYSGDNASWSMRPGHLHYDRSQLRFDPDTPAKQGSQYMGITFLKPTWNNMPTMISEASWNRPNRHRSEGAAIFAAYGALHDMDALVFFTLDSNGRRWTVQPRYVMQPWTLLSPAAMGQFPATALIYRKGLVREAAPATTLNLNLQRLKDLEGMPFAQRDGMDNLRELGQDDYADTDSGTRLIGLRKLAGGLSIQISDTDQPSDLPDLSDYIDLTAKRARSLTSELTFNWGDGILTIDSPLAQGLLLAQGAIDPIATRDLVIESANEIFNLLLVSLDGEPIASSRSMLLQVMTEETPTQFITEPQADGGQRILDIGIDPWLVRAIDGCVTFKGNPVQVTILDQSGYPLGETSQLSPTVCLHPQRIYYHLTRPAGAVP